jgi:hypothetical protein
MRSGMLAPPDVAQVRGILRTPFPTRLTNTEGLDARFEPVLPDCHVARLPLRLGGLSA